MVQDEEGRWWARSRETGEWHYRDGEAWIPATPPGGSAARKRPAVLGAAAAAFAGIAWVVFVALIILLLSGLPVPEPVLDAAFIVALAGLAGLRARQEPVYGRLGAAGFLTAFAGTTLVLISFVLILES